MAIDDGYPLCDQWPCCGCHIAAVLLLQLLLVVELLRSLRFERVPARCRDASSLSSSSSSSSSSDSKKCSWSTTIRSACSF